MNDKTIGNEYLHISKLPFVIVNHVWLPTNSENEYNDISKLYNPKVHSFGIFYGDSLTHGISKFFRIKDWLTDGYNQLCNKDEKCMLTHTSYLFEKILIKMGQNLIHELFTGVYCLNGLYNKIPNFLYIYGGFKCNTNYLPKVNGSTLQDVENYDGKYDLYDPNPISHILCENLNSDVTLDIFVSNCNLEDFLDKWLQICFSLQLAYTECEFVHNNLSCNKIYIWNKFNGNFRCILYGNVQICTNSVAVLTDFTECSFKYKNEYYSVKNIDNHNPLNDYTNLCKDLLKYCENNTEIYNCIKGILQNLEEKNIISHINWCIQKYKPKCIIPNESVLKLITNCYNVGMDYSSLKFISGFSNDCTNIDLYTFYDCVLYHKAHKLDLNKLYSSCTSHVDLWLDNIYKLMFDKMKELNKLLNSLYIPVAINTDLIYTDLYYKLCKSYIERVLKCIQIYTCLSTQSHIVKNVLNIYPKIKENKEYIKHLSEIETKYKSLNNHCIWIHKFVKEIWNIKNSQGDNENSFNNIDEKFTFYHTDLVLNNVLIKSKFFKE
jgi:hypothetical protein